MSGKNVCLCALTLALFGAAAAHAQYPDVPRYERSATAPPPAEAGQLLANDPVPLYGLSSWILYNQPGCCGPLGNQVPLRYELYLRAGPAIPTGGNLLDQTLETGWAIQGGARLLFFNQPQTKAWTFDVGIANIHQNGRRPDVRIPIELNDRFPNPNFNPILPVSATNPQNITVGEVSTSIRSLNRTFVSLAAGREWYLVGTGAGVGPAWRVGADVGGSWGSAKVEFNEIRFRTDAFGRFFAALHSDLDIPCGCCIFQAGFRAEWGHTWSDILQRQNNGDLQDVLLLGTLGVRF